MQENLYHFLDTGVRKNPHKVAIDENGNNISYFQLQQRVHELIWVFQQKGIKPGQFIGVHLKPSSELVAILLAITKLGAIFVPLETSYPKKRLFFMIKDAELSYLITDKPDEEFTKQVSCIQLLLKDLSTDQTVNLNLADMVDSKPEDVCYVIYTSGTTGNPKGVLVNYQGSMNTVIQSALTMDIQPHHRLLQLSPISFDVFVLEVGMVLFAEATLVFTNDIENLPLDKLLVKHNIQHMLCTPNFAADVDLRNTPLHTVMFGGEPMPSTMVEQYLGHFNMVHAYGVTEASICSTLGLCDGIYPVSIGSPIANTYLKLVDDNLNPVPAGEVGEIVVGGKGVSNGYINRPEITEYRFIPDPNNLDARLFRTGDLAKYDEYGRLLFLGRNDRQIKYKEHRLELFEVEALMLRHPKVTQAATVLKEEEDQLYGFVCLNALNVEAEEISQHLKQYLLESLVPKIILIDKMPLTSHNKIDYVTLKKGI